jgi:hypothetical protein
MGEGQQSDRVRGMKLGPPKYFPKRVGIAAFQREGLQAFRTSPQAEPLWGWVVGFLCANVGGDVRF